MKISFEKYHGAGNDFILIDNRKRIFPADQKTIERLCHRRLGIGADGLILIQNHPDFDFEMIYFNADGNIGSMCGNGGRCAVILAKKLGLTGNTATFMAFDGIHRATIKDNDTVQLSMGSVTNISVTDNAYVMDTGSPHYISFAESMNDLDVIAEGKKIRYSESYNDKGINVNFVQLKEGGFLMRTYERGVEDETLSCGTGTVASAIAVSLKLNKTESEQSFSVHALGGDLAVHFRRESADHFTNVFLEGPVAFVFSGVIEVCEEFS